MGNPDSPNADLPEKETVSAPEAASVDTDDTKTPETDQPRDTKDIEAQIEDHILPRLDPDFLAYYVAVQLRLEAPQQGQRPVTNPTIEHVRAHPEAYQPPCAIDTSSHPRVADSCYQSQDGASIRARVYHPDPAEHGDGPYPAHLNFHGGGFVLGDLKTEAALCLSMREAGVVVVDVDYRLCPETTWGKCMQDAWGALEWVRNSAATLNVNPSSLSIGGISAGAHICLVLQHMARDAGIPLKLCLASVAPATDALSYTYYTDSPFASFHEFHRGPVLPWERIKYFGRLCMPPERLRDLRAAWPDWWFAPLRAPDWRGLCDTFVRTGELDPLRDEGEAYAARLVAGGNKVTVKRYLGCPHTFMYVDSMKPKQEYDRDAVAALKAAHGLA